jgi:hypothetical protein
VIIYGLLLDALSILRDFNNKRGRELKATFKIIFHLFAQFNFYKNKVHIVENILVLVEKKAKSLKMFVYRWENEYYIGVITTILFW